MNALANETGGLQRLLALAGAWRGEEDMSATQWTPAGKAEAEVLAEAEMNGMFLNQSYRQTRDGRVSFRSRSIFGVDGSDGLVKMLQFDSMGFFPASPASGSWDGNALVLDRSSPRGSARISYFIEGPDNYRTMLEFKPAGANIWQDMAVGAFRRVAPSSINLA
jgi:hypothetical protein